MKDIETYEDLVAFILKILADSKFREHPKNINRRPPINWLIDRERVNIVIPLLHYLREKDLNIPFERESNSEKSILDAMLVAIGKFSIFEFTTYEQLKQKYETSNKMDIGLLKL